MFRKFFARPRYSYGALARTDALIAKNPNWFLITKWDRWFNCPRRKDVL